MDETYLSWESTVYPDGGMCVTLARWPACTRKAAARSLTLVSERRRYEGLMKDGQCHGKGVFQYADGDRCVRRGRRGSVRAGVHTLSTDALTRARRYEGEYLEGQMNGLGVYRWSNGRRALRHASRAARQPRPQRLN
jgi:hypothetical protein